MERHEIPSGRCSDLWRGTSSKLSVAKVRDDIGKRHLSRLLRSDELMRARD